MTAEPGLLLAILTADCLPILIADARQRVVAAIHAGWRGTLKRIAEKTVGRMRFLYESRPEVMAVIHNHCYDVLPFSITRTPMRPAVHNARRIGENVPVWEIRDKFGDTDLLVTTMDQGRDLASVLRANKAALMRALESGKFATVRGSVKFAANHFPIQNFYLRVIGKDSQGRVTNKTIGTVFTNHVDAFVSKCKMKAP